MTFGSVCSGIEAASVAWAPLGWRGAFVSEIEPFPCAVLQRHYPEVPNYGDMTKYEGWNSTDGIDVLVGGTPCQAFSVAGLRKGLGDPRGNLTLTFLGIVERFAPRWVVWENVPGVLSDKTGAFGAFLGGLGQLGYGFAWRILDAQYFGVAQRRRRVFVVGHSGGAWQRAAAVLFERASLCGDPPPSRKTGQSVTGTIAGCSNGGGANGPGRTADDADILVVAGTLGRRGIRSHTELDGHGAYVPVQVSGAVSAKWAKGSGGPAGDECYNLVAAQVYSVRTAQTSSNGIGIDSSVSHTLDNTGTPPAVAHPAIAFTERTRAEGRTFEAQEELAYALTNPGSGGRTHSRQILQGMGVRRLTPRECERLQGFPDDYTRIAWRGKVEEECPDGPRYRAIGNSMAVPVMRWIGQRIVFVEEVLGLIKNL